MQKTKQKKNIAIKKEIKPTINNIVLKFINLSSKKICKNPNSAIHPIALYKK